MKVKRLISLLITLMLVVGVISVCAYATGDEGIEPYGQVIQCPNCYNGAATVSAPNVRTTRDWVSGCNSYTSPHYHEITRSYLTYDCKNCGTFTRHSVTRNVCCR